MSSRNYDKKIFRLVYILNKLDAGKKVTTRALAEEFNVSFRTVQRDLELLNMAGFPLVSPEKGIHTFMQGFSLKKIMTSKEEASLLSFLYEVAKSLGGTFEDSFREILRKVLSKGTGSPFYLKIPDGVKLNRKHPDIKQLETAIQQNRAIEMHYLTAGKEKWFRVDPLKIIFFDGFWYLLGRIHGKEWIIKFRLERIKDIEMLDEQFLKPANLNTVLDESVNIWFSEKRDKKVVLKVGRDVAHYFRQRIYFPLQKIKKENKDGSLIMETTVSNYMEVIPVIFQWIPHIKVTAPKELKEETKAIVEEYRHVV